MAYKKKDKKSDTALEEITCPNCNSQIGLDKLGVVMFKTCTVFSCPVCKKTIAIQPKGKEFER